MGETWARVIARHVPEATLVAVSGGRRAGGGGRRCSAPRRSTRTPSSPAPDIDAVVVATPVPTHRPIAEAAARAGKHVIVEKPMTNTRADADAMVAAADAAGVRLAIVSQHRYRGAPMAAKAAIDAGRIGSIRMIRVFGPNAGWDIPADHWNSQREQVSPYMDWGAHACDIIRWLTGAEATLAFAQFASYTDVPPADQSSMATYTLDNGVLVQIWLTYELPPPTLGSAMQMLIAGSDGIIEARRVRDGPPGHAGRRLGDDLRAAAVRPARRRGLGPAAGLRQPAARPDGGHRRGPRPVRQRPPGGADDVLARGRRAVRRDRRERPPVAVGPCVLTASASCCERAARRSGRTSTRPGRRSSRSSATPASTTTSSSPASTRRTTCTGSTTSAGRPSCTGSAR